MIFRKLNIMEYKSPTDYVSIDRFYRVCSYAHLLKSGAQHEDEIDIFDITITCVSKKINQKLFNHLTEKRKYEMSRHTDGVYYFQKEGEIPIQFIIQEELSVAIMPDTAKFYGIFTAQAHGKSAGTIVKMTGYTADFTGNLEADSEIAEIVWLSYSDVEGVSPVDKLIFADLYAQGLLKQ